MIKSYEETPKFGDSKPFQEEMKKIAKEVNKYEDEVVILTRELDLVESKMMMNMRHSLLVSTSKSLSSLDNSSEMTSEISDKIDSMSNSFDNLEESIDMEEEYKHIDKTKSQSKNIIKEFSHKHTGVHEENSLDKHAEVVGITEGIDKTRVIAVYSFEGLEEGTICMDFGEEFELLESDDDGWCKVKRAEFNEEGFVPSAFIVPL